MTIKIFNDIDGRNDTRLIIFNNTQIIIGYRCRFLESKKRDMYDIAEALKLNQTIECLILEWNKLKFNINEIKYISQALIYNRSIKELIIKRETLNKLTNEGIKYIFDGLKMNKSITSFYLNKLNRNEIKQLGKILMVNNTIIELRINFVKIDRFKINYLINQVKNTKILIYIFLNNSYINNNEFKYVIEIMQINNLIVNLDKDYLESLNVKMRKYYNKIKASHLIIKERNAYQKNGNV